ncbi:MAG: hypothetical protein WCO84_04435 [bacterium]
MKKFLVFSFFVLLIVVIALGMTGFVPGLSEFMGANKARDLGVVPSREVFDSVLKANGFVLNDNAGFGPNTKISYQGQKTVDATLSDNEIASLLNFNHAEKFPIKDAQVKIHKDGTLEVSAKVSIKNYKGYSLENAVYVKGKIEVISPTSIKINPEQVEIGRFPFPMTERVTSALNREANSILSTITGLSIQSVSYDEGKVNFKGTIPALAKRVLR